MPVACKARRTNGTPCGNFAMRGGFVCHAHGGKAPAVRAAAAVRLAEAALERDRRKTQKRVKAIVTEERLRREAVKPWIEELGPRYMWEWHPPAALRRIATEMRNAATELTQLARAAEERQTQCTSS